MDLVPLSHTLPRVPQMTCVLLKELLVGSPPPFLEEDQLPIQWPQDSSGLKFKVAVCIPLGLQPHPQKVVGVDLGGLTTF